MHEHAVELARLHIADLDGLVAPAHDLSVGDVGDRGGQLAPLQHNVLDHAARRVHVHALVVVAEEQVHAGTVGQDHDRVRLDVRVGGRAPRHVDVNDVARVEVDSVEATARAVQHLHARLLLDGQVDEQRPVLQIRKRLEGHELAVGLLRPGVHLNAVAQAHHQELDLVELNDLEVDAALQLAHIHKAGLLLHRARLDYLVLEPAQVVHAYLVLLARDGHQDVDALEDLDLLEAATIYQRVHLALATPVEKHERVLRSDEQIDPYTQIEKEIRRL